MKLRNNKIKTDFLPKKRIYRKKNIILKLESVPCEARCTDLRRFFMSRGITIEMGNIFMTGYMGEVFITLNTSQDLQQALEKFEKDFGGNFLVCWCRVSYRIATIQEFNEALYNFPKRSFIYWDDV